MPTRQLKVKISREDLERFSRERYLPRELTHMKLTGVQPKVDGKNDLQFVVIEFTEVNVSSSAEEEGTYWLIERTDMGYPEWLVYQEHSCHLGFWSSNVHEVTRFPIDKAVDMAKRVCDTLNIAAVATEHEDVENDKGKI